MASQSPPDQDDVRPIRRESSTIQRLGKKARTLTIGSAHAKEVPEEDEVRQESYPIYHLRWEQKLKPFLEKRYPELKARYENKDVCRPLLPEILALLSADLCVIGFKR
jgi:hypothetical protein